MSDEKENVTVNDRSAVVPPDECDQYGVFEKNEIPDETVPEESVGAGAESQSDFDVIDFEDSEILIPEKPDILETEAGTETVESNASPQVLTQIFEELNSIRSELSALKKAIVPKKESVATKQKGFFDDDGDEKIALSDVELDNILTTSDFIAEPEEVLDMESDSDVIEAPEDISYLENDPLKNFDADSLNLEAGENAEPLDLDAIISDSIESAKNELAQENALDSKETAEEIPVDTEISADTASVREAFAQWQSLTNNGQRTSLSADSGESIAPEIPEPSPEPQAEKVWVEEPIDLDWSEVENSNITDEEPEPVEAIPFNEEPELAEAIPSNEEPELAVEEIPSNEEPNPAEVADSNASEEIPAGENTEIKEFTDSESVAESSVTTDSSEEEMEALEPINLGDSDSFEDDLVGDSLGGLDASLADSGEEEMEALEPINLGDSDSFEDDLVGDSLGGLDVSLADSGP